jgi:rubredoxin
MVELAVWWVNLDAIAEAHATEAPPDREAGLREYKTIDTTTTSSQCYVMKSYMCLICGFIYSEEEGDPDSGIAPGTRWDDVPLSWRCPDCGAGKEDFEMVEI